MTPFEKALAALSNDRQRAFVREYLVDKNGTQAAIRAGYSAKTAESQASALLSNPKVADAVRMGLAALAERLDVTAERVLSEAARIAFSDPRRLFDEDGNLIPAHMLDENTARAIASVEVFEEFEGKGKDRKLIGYTKKIKFWDKNSASERLMKHLGLFEKDNKQKTDPLKELLQSLSGNVFGVAKE